MRVSSQMKLLAGMAAVLGLCMTSGGCKSSSVCRDCNEPTCSTCATSDTVVSEESGVIGKIRPLFVRRSSTQEPLLAAPSGCDHCQSAMMLHPVPVGSATASSEASGWTVVQRPDGEGQTGGGELRPAVTLERPEPGPLLQPTSGQGEVLPTPIPVAPGELQSGSDDARANAAPPPRAEILPSPRPLGGGKAPPGYPDLPPVVITHPVDAPRELSKRAFSAYIIEPPDILVVEGLAKLFDAALPLAGPHLVRPDGTIGLGTYGSIFVAGMTIDQAKLQIAQVVMAARGSKSNAMGKEAVTLTLKDFLDGIKVDIAAYNSKFYYVITDGGGFGEQVIRLPCVGNETVLDAISQIQGLPAVASKKHIWVARATTGDANHPYIMPVDWCAITQRAVTLTNYQLYPGDRVYVNSNAFIRADSVLQKFLAPIERVLGVTLLGSSVVNSIKSGNNSGTGNNLR